MDLLMGTTATGGKLCLLLRQPEGVEGRSTVVTYLPDARPQWLQQTFDGEFVALCPAPANSRGADFLALTGEGLVYFLRSGTSVQIPGAGFNRPGSRNLGRMDNLMLLGTELVATGYGGQAYRATDGENWAPAAPTFPIPPVSQDTIRFGWAALQSARFRYVFGGEVVTGLSIPTDFGGLGGATNIAAMIRAQARRDYGTLWLLQDGRWQDVELPTNSTLDQIVTADGKIVYLRFRPGVVYSTTDFADMTEVAVNDAGLSALGVHQGSALLADEASLFTLAPDGTAPFEPPLPPMTDRMLELSSSDGILHVIRESSVWRLVAGTWEEIAIPPDVVALPR
ncbi:MULTISPECIES: hypothetical protein [Phyllobacteriaceae]|jgi:hypothetical protein|nr:MULTISPECIES: hypothetical protein [Mesorhizobium]MBN9233904.1 hypothetical protein [Mesorhizobium sp.]MDQ0331435.1 hypothetical protein [Mesorhizobium sp. YL-MeA3-2017]